MERLLFVTGNPGKLSEARRLWGGELESVSIDLPEIQSGDLREVLGAKGREARRQLRDAPPAVPVVVEETGLEIDAFGGFPGPLVKWMLEAMGAAGIERAARLVARDDDHPTTGATARCLLLYLDGERELVAEGALRGRLVPPRGAGGFGWDPIFLPEGETRTFAELPDGEKDRISHRGRAWRDLAERLAAG